MKKNHVNRIRRPPDEAALRRMGLLTPEGEIDQGMLDAFIRIFAGQFVTDLCNSLASLEEIEELLAILTPMVEAGNEDAVYLMISVQYDGMRKPLPDPIWSLFSHQRLQRAFSAGFFRQWKALIPELAEKEAAQDGKTADDRPV